VLEGSVQRFGNRVRVNAQLIDAETDAHLDSGGLISHTGTAGIGAPPPLAWRWAKVSCPPNRADQIARGYGRKGA